MTRKVSKITAVGTSGDVKGVVFQAKPDTTGRFVLNKKAGSATGNKTNRAVNKVYVGSLDEAAELLQTNEYLINLVSPKGTRALRQFKAVTIEYF